MVFINILLILASILLIVVVLMQEGNKQGLGVIGGAAETFLGKNKAKSYEGKLLMITRILAAVFVVLAIFATWMNARSYTVTYMVEATNDAGETVEVEYYPYAASYVASNNYMAQIGMEGYAETDYATVVANSDADVLRRYTTYKNGTEITAYATPYKEGYNGVWLTKDGKELPKEMDRTNYTVYANYTIGTYTVKVTDKGVDGTAENVLIDVTGEFGTPIDTSSAVLPEKMEGYRITWSETVPEKIPGENKDITVVYTAGNYIKYYNEAGEEYYPAALYSANYVAEYERYIEVMSMDAEALEAYLENSDEEAETAAIEARAKELYDNLYAKAVENDDMDSLRHFVANGAEITAYAVPAKEGYTGAWDVEVPATMEGQLIELHPVYTEAAPEATEGEATEEAPVEETSAEETPVEEAPAEETPVVETPADETAATPAE